MPRYIVLLAALLVLAVPASASADITVTEGTQFSGSLGSFTENCPIDPGTTVHVCGQLKPSGTVTWGDGGTSTATFTRQPVHTTGGSKPCIGNYASCTFVVSGTYTYTGAGTFTGSADWTDATNGIHTNSGSIPFKATSTDVQVSLSGASIVRSGQTATLTATLNDGNSYAQPCDYQVTIEWGDGKTSPGVVNNTNCTIARAHAAAATAPPYTITGSHTYAVEPGSAASVTALDRGGSTATITVDVPSPAQVTTEAATGVGQTSATLNAFVDPQGGQLQDCHLEWGTTTSYGHTVLCSPASFSTPRSVSATLTGLTPSTHYHYRVVVRTNVGTKSGLDQGFVTLQPVVVGAPTVLTLIADQVTSTGARLSGVVNTHGQTASDCHFEWGTSMSYGNAAPCAPANPSGGQDVNVSAVLSGLAPDTTYHFRIVAANAGASASAGADASFATRPQCDIEPAFGYVDAKGCFAHTGNVYTSTPGSTVTIDGLTLTPDDATTAITIDPSNATVVASAAVKVGAGQNTLYDGKFRWTEPDPNGGLSVKIGTLPPPSGTAIAGMALDGDLSLSFNNQKGADLTGNAWLPFGPFSGATGINATIELHTALGIGLKQDQLKLTRDDLQIDGVGVKNLKVVYSPSSDAWEGSAQITLPTANKLAIGADLAFQHGEFHKFSGSLDNINFPIVGGVDLQRISVVFGVNPTTIGGSLGLSFGPEIDGKQLAALDGNFLYQAATPQAAGFIKVGGSLTLASFKVAGAYFDYFTTGAVRFGGHLQLGLPDSSASDPSKQPVYIDTGFDGAVDGSKFDVDVKATVALNFIDLTLGAEVLVSDKGLVACGDVSAFGFTWNPGVGYTWATHAFDLMADGCSVGPWKTLDLGAATSAVSTSRTLRLRPGRSLLELKGVSGAPHVTLTGPHGQHVSVPTATTKPLIVPGLMVFQDPVDKTTWIAIQHGAGSWRLKLEPGSSAIARIRSAGLLQAPSITGRVTGNGRRRTLRWRLRPLAGQRVVFWEKGPDVARIIGSTSAARGKLRFTPAAGHAGRRTIVAQVTEFGRPRADIRIARYTAAAAARPGRPEHLKVTAEPGGAVRVSWTAARFAQQYVVEVDNKDGARLIQFTGRGSRALVVHDVVPITTATVTVTALRTDGVRGPAAQVHYPMQARR